MKTTKHGNALHDAGEDRRVTVPDDDGIPANPTRCGFCAQPDTGPYRRALVETIAGRFWVWLCEPCGRRLPKQRVEE